MGVLEKYLAGCGNELDVDPCAGCTYEKECDLLHGDECKLAGGKNVHPNEV